ncbi:MAG: DUF58 domain-containing protein [Burkholderiaceae bacterium]
MRAPSALLSLADLINAPAFTPPTRRRSKTGRPIAGLFGEGIHPGKRRGAGMDLDSIGVFQDGDDPRHIDWSATARTGRPQVRRFLTTVHRPLAILVDLRPSMYFGTAGGLLASRACLQAAALSTHSRQRREPSAICSFGTLRDNGHLVLKASTSARARALSLDKLFSDYQAGLETPERESASLAETLEQCWASLPFDFDIVVVSDFSNADERLGQVIALRRKQSVHALIVADPVFKNGFKAGVYPGRAGPNATVEIYQLATQSIKSQFEQISLWRNELVARLERSGLGTIWDPTR